MSADVTWKDLGLKAFFKKVDNAEVKAIRVGVVGQQAAETNEHGVTYGAVALYNEFGTSDGHVPERSFIRPVLNNRSVVLRAGKAAGLAYFKLGLDLAESLRFAALPIIEAIRQNLHDGRFKRNAPDTIEKKGFDKPLYEHGGLEKAVGYQVVRRGGDVVESGASMDEFQAFEVSSGGGGPGGEE